MGRLIVDHPADGVWNMSVDQALLDSAEQAGDWTLRIYSWSEPTLSLGYFQKYADRHHHQESLRAACVRRSTGGGAILHDDDLTYSLISPASDRWSSKNQRLYFAVHGALRSALEQQDIAVSLQPDPGKSEEASREEAFLCFLRRAHGDVILDSHKICGSAQRRAKHAIMQHGSMNLGTSRFAPQIKGLDDLAPPIDRQQFIADWVEAISTAFKRSFETADLSDTERASADQIAKTKFGSSAWNEKR